DGSLDTSFGGGGKVLTSIGDRAWASAVTIQPDGKIVATGRGRDTNLTSDFVVVRYNAPAAPRSGTVTSVSAASFIGPAVASEQIIAAFGTELATRTEAAASTPLPIQLAGSTIRVLDSTGNEPLAP